MAVGEGHQSTRPADGLREARLSDSRLPHVHSTSARLREAHRTRNRDHAGLAAQRNVRRPRGRAGRAPVEAEVPGAFPRSAALQGGVTVLFANSELMGTFKGFNEKGLEFAAEIIAPYEGSMLDRPQLGQFLLIELGSRRRRRLAASRGSFLPGCWQRRRERTTSTRCSAANRMCPRTSNSSDSSTECK